MTSTPKIELLRRMYDVAVAAAQPSNCLPPHLPDVPSNGRLLITGAGKATGEMARVAEQHYADNTDGFVGHRILSTLTTRHGYALPLERLSIIEAGHPVPDEGSIAGAKAALDLAAQATEDDLVLVLLSGGASALWASPVDGVTLEQKQHVTKSLLRAGARISETNCVRRHLSSIKGGRLAARAAPAKVITLAISDVPGDAPESIGSGPTVADPTTLADAREIIARYDIDLPDNVAKALNNDGNETLKPNASELAHAVYTLIAKPAESLAKAAAIARDAGYEIIELGDALEGEARDVAAEHAHQALDIAASGRKAAIISGGELTVTVRGNGKGGPNQEYALALAEALESHQHIYALAADTDGSDGGDGAPNDPAGAYVHPDTLNKSASLGISVAHALQNNDATGFFQQIDDLLVTGPTQTNVNDFRAILVG